MMRDYILRPVEDKDLAQIIKIWSSSFGDDEKFILALIKSCGLLSTGVCAEMDGAARSFMFAFDGLRLDGKNTSYIYALCTEDSHRGMGLGRAVTAYAAQQAASRGAEFVFLFPADDSLEKWYSSVLGAVSFGRRSFEALETFPSFSSELREIGPEEYLSLRGKDIWEIPISLLIAQDSIHRHCGGGFFACGNCILSAETCGGKLFVRETFGSGKEAAISAVADKLGCREVYILKKSKAGQGIMFIPPFLPNVPDISCLMPFTLD